MRRRLLNVLTVLSLLVCVAVGALWVRSYLVRDWILRARLVALADHPDSETLKRVDINKRAWQVISARGRLMIGFTNWYLRPNVDRSLYPVGGPPTFQRSWQGEPRGTFPPAETSLERIGFMLRSTSTPSPFGTGNDTALSLAFPLWLPFALSAILPGLWAKRRLAARRVRRLGLCPRCGYDLRATPGKCPECGAAGAGTTLRRVLTLLTGRNRRAKRGNPNLDVPMRFATLQ